MCTSSIPAQGWPGAYNSLTLTAPNQAQLEADIGFCIKYHRGETLEPLIDDPLS